MKKMITSIAILTIAAAQISCKKWLDVKPQDQSTQSTAYATKTSTYQVLNSIYLSMAGGKMYGAYMTMFYPEILAQQYNIGTNHSYYTLSTYDYTLAKQLTYIDAIWSNTYTQIAQVNNFLQGIDQYKTLDPWQDSVVRGESYGLRAYMHLDMLRLYGPMYNSADSGNLSIPYYSVISTTFNPYLKASQVMDSIEADLIRAEQFLANDPILSYGVAGNTNDAFFTKRNYRMNYYAVKALQARFYMYRGNKTAAYAAANVVISKAQSLFPWITTTALITNANNPDRVFSTELLFALQSTDMYGNYNNYYSPTLLETSILAPLPNRLVTTFEDPANAADFRYTNLWIYPSTGTKSFRTFYKYADVQSPATAFRYMMPMLRMSEMYYIAAECAPDNATAFAYLNTVRYNRNLTNLTGTTTLRSELTKEYQKEFIGEGQLFYYYKRINQATIPNGAATSGSITMTSAKYVVPKPASETDYHQ